jgi:hypothetical protein
MLCSISDNWKQDDTDECLIDTPPFNNTFNAIDYEVVQFSNACHSFRHIDPFLFLLPSNEKFGMK